MIFRVLFIYYSNYQTLVKNGILFLHKLLC